MMMRPFYSAAFAAEDLDRLRKQLVRMFPEYAQEMDLPSAPPLAVSESANAFHVRLLLPGLDPDQLQIEADAKSLTIEGPWPELQLREGESWLLNEFPKSEGTFRRALSFKSPVAFEQIQAEYKHGVLTLTVPKQETEQKRTIKIQVNES